MAIAELLNRLSSDDYAMCVRMSTGGAMRQMIRRSSEFDALRACLYSGELTEETLERHINLILSGIRPGTIIRGEITLAAVAVLLEGYSSELAEDFFQKMTACNLAELGMVPAVARACLRVRSQRMARVYVEESYFLENQNPEPAVFSTLIGITRATSVFRSNNIFPRAEEKHAYA